jgi:LPS sulfotransferase NodH
VGQTLKIPLGRRPDLVEMASPEFDLASEKPAQKTLLICSAPRTGSYELCRFLIAAGIGIPHEYFHSQFANEISKRFGLSGNPLESENISPYIEALRRNRSQNGVLAINMQYWQFSGHLMNGPGAALFKNALVVHLFRPDIGSQLTSWRMAMNTGIWDFSPRQTSEPRRYPLELEKRVEQYRNDLKFVAGEDTGFRELFALAGIRPYFKTMEDFFRAPHEAVDHIAKELSVPLNKEALDAAIAVSKPYAPNEIARQLATLELAEPLRKKAFLIE